MTRGHDSIAVAVVSSKRGLFPLAACIMFRARFITIACNFPTHPSKPVSCSLSSLANFSAQAYGLASDPDDGADINEDVFDWNGEFQVCMCACGRHGAPCGVCRFAGQQGAGGKRLLRLFVSRGAC